MKAVRIHEDGGPDVLVLEDVPDPEAGAGEVLVELRAAALNHLDVWIRRGLPSVPKPRILGADGAGVVAALGAGVAGFEIGERVVINPGIPHDGRITVIGEHTDGTYCELKAIPASQLHALAGSLSFEEGAAFPLVFETAHRMLVTKAGVREGENVLIWGIGGGVALASLEICRAFGARTIVTSSSAEKLELAAAAGADVLVDHSVDDVVEVDGSSVKVLYSLTSMGCPAGAMIADGIVDVASSVPGVENVEAELTFDPPWTPDRMSEDAKFILGFG